MFYWGYSALRDHLQLYLYTLENPGFPGAIFELFSARFKASMAAFNAEIASSCSFSCWSFVSVVESQDEVWCKGCEERLEALRPRPNKPICEENGARGRGIFADPRHSSKVP